MTHWRERRVERWRDLDGPALRLVREPERRAPERPALLLLAWTVVGLASGLALATAIWAMGGGW